MAKVTFDRDNLIRDLKSNAVRVYFTKVNGDKRELRCSLKPDLLPPQTIHEHLDEMHNKPENKETVAVWDLDNGGWKSFRIENVEYVEFLDAF
jgi:hypothetical protein